MPMTGRFPTREERQGQGRSEMWKQSRSQTQNGVQIRFDETAMSPFFNYTSNGTEHEVWFEDVRSIDVKVRTAKEYGFTGVGYWNLMRPFRANWLLLDSLFQLNDRP